MTRPRNGLDIAFYSTPEFPCSYLPDRNAVTLFVDPAIPKTASTHGLLSAHGFRRSGEHLYRPRCPACTACVSVRVPVNEFRPRRRHRRVLAANRDVEVRALAPTFKRSHFALYQRYLRARHAESSMNEASPDNFLSFLTASWADSVFYEFLRGGELVAVAVVDQMVGALSAVYTFYEPDMPARSLGTFAILHEIELARGLGLEWLYLGYWIEDCDKMRYKDDFQPLEYFIDGHWTRRIDLAG